MLFPFFAHSDPRFLIGVVIYISGFVMNRWSDWKLRSLRENRKPEGKTLYKTRYKRCQKVSKGMLIWTTILYGKRSKALPAETPSIFAM